MDEDYIEKEFGCRIESDGVECRVPYGGVLLFSNALVHRSYSNLSDKIRWSMDLRWQVGRGWPIRRVGTGFIQEIKKFLDISHYIDFVNL